MNTLAALAFCAFVAACGSQDDGAVPELPIIESETEPESADAQDPAPATSSSTTSSTPTTTPEDTTSSTEAESTEPAIPEPSDGKAFEEYIAGQVEGFFKVRDRGFESPSAAPEVDYPELANFAAGRQLEVMQDAIRSKVERGLLTREPDEPLVGVSVDEEHRTSGIITLEDDVLTVFDCELNDNVLYYSATGEIEDDRAITILIVATLSRFDDGWKLTHTEATQKIEGVAGCFLAAEADFPY